MDAVVDGFVGVEHRLHVRVLNGQEGPRVLVGLVTGSRPNRDPQLHRRGHHRRLSQHCDAAAQCRHVDFGGVGGCVVHNNVLTLHKW